ncbi:phosphopantetheine-binding protein [Streptomyces sp. NPDC052042]|uniref:phosphopantetheine-binding protein n=1 Tax=Streptomyces sp. NPDC052042 TaxID=3365683 RepID=UPI0037D8847F
MTTAPDRIRDIVLLLLEVEESDVTETSLFKDHGADSMRIIEIQAELEREFDIVIEKAEAAHLIHLRGAREVVARATAATTENAR